MNHLGAPHQFLGDVLPADFRAEIFSLVDAAWCRVKCPHDIRFEPRITGLLQLAMIEEHESIYEADPPFDIREDVKIRDPITGKESERMDLGIWLRQCYIKGQKPYFVFESKKLNISRVGVLDSNVHDYAGPEGLGHLLAGGYHSSHDRSGMIAFVMDGNISTAKQSVEKQLDRKADELRLLGAAKIHPSALMPKGSPHGETHHTSGGQTSVIFHMFLAVSRSRR